MTPIKPEDRPKAIALSLAVVAVFGFGVVNIGKQTGLFRGSAPAAPTPDPVADAAAVPPVAAAEGQAAGTVASGTPLANGAMPTVPTQADTPASSEPVAMPNLAYDPFRPIGVIPTSPGSAAPAPPAASAAPRSAAPPQPQTMPGNLPPTQIVGRMSVQPSTTPIRPAGPTGVAPVLIPEPEIELVGVALGEASVAMLRTGDEQHFVRVGEKIKGSWVARIQTDVVTVRKGKKDRVLRVGGGPGETMMATTTAPPSAVATPAAKPVPAVTPMPRVRLIPRKAVATAVVPTRSPQPVVLPEPLPEALPETAPPPVSAPPVATSPVPAAPLPPATVPPTTPPANETAPPPAVPPVVPTQEVLPPVKQGEENEELGEPPVTDPLGETAPPVVPPTSPPPGA
ncbi:MAG TPA: hypothetical protein VM490_23655 [Armatimonadaceae bacterium]|nr:hypothetical protein [Armatimonadaceae bacterium]